MLFLAKCALSNHNATPLSLLNRLAILSSRPEQLFKPGVAPLRLRAQQGPRGVQGGGAEGVLRQAPLRHGAGQEGPQALSCAIVEPAQRIGRWSQDPRPSAHRRLSEEKRLCPCSWGCREGVAPPSARVRGRRELPPNWSAFEARSALR